jgi:hypothetical protein
MSNTGSRYVNYNNNNNNWSSNRPANAMRERNNNWSTNRPAIAVGGENNNREGGGGDRSRARAAAPTYNAEITRETQRQLKSK